MRVQRVTPDQFSVLCATLVMLKAQGIDPATCSKKAFKQAGVPPPKPGEEVEIVIDREMRR
jgi:hypothetical protein